MNSKMTWQKILILCALFIAPLLLAHCGDGSEHIPSAHVGPSGPTIPSNYYFELTVAPHTVYRGGWVLVVVRISDQYKNAAPDVEVHLTTSGFNMVTMEGGGVTDKNGMWRTHVEIEADTAYIGYITVEVEGSMLTLPVTVVSQGSAV